MSADVIGAYSAENHTQETVDDNCRRGDRVNHGRTILRNVQACRCCHCCASRTTEVDGQLSQRRYVSVGVLPDALASRELVQVSPLTNKKGDSGKR